MYDLLYTIFQLKKIYSFKISFSKIKFKNFLIYKLKLILLILNWN